jgi:hypothetical protein
MAIDALDMPAGGGPVGPRIEGPDGLLAGALDRIEQALARLEAAVAAGPVTLPAIGPATGPAAAPPENTGELASLRARHRKLKDTVTQELRQLDLLLANLPQ